MAMTMTPGSRTGRDAGALARGIVDKGNHHSAGISSRSGLARRVWASSEAGSCTARVKRAPSSGVSAAHILSAETLSTNVQYSVPGATRPSGTHQSQYPPHDKVEQSQCQCQYWLAASAHVG